ncbi:MAG: hypothetical protein JWO37_1414 [Acidimicrobiales bacterium]|nr:hypothetical protein [Acidimicrobiales bacterium]
MTPRRRSAIEAVAVVAVGIAIAIVTTWPLAARMGHTAHDPFDPRFQAWTIDWVQHALTSPRHLFDANIFHPERGTLAYSDPLIGIAAPLVPLRWLGVSAIGRLNAAILLGFALSAAAAYAFGRVVTRSRVAGAVTAAAFAFGPYGTLEAGHLQVVMRPGVALAALAAWLIVDRVDDGRSPWPAVAGLVAAVAWQASVSFYPGLYAIAAAAVVLVVRRRAWRPAAAALAGSVAAVGLLALPYVARHRALPGFRWTLADLRLEGADFWHADPRLSIWGHLLGGGRTWPVVRPPVFPGVTVLALALAGLVVGWRAGGRDRRAAITGAALTVVGAVAAIGTADTGWRRFAPYRLVFELPGGPALRATSRAWMIGLLGLGLLAGMGAAALARVGRSRRAVAVTVATVAVLAIVGEGFRNWNGTLTDVRRRPVDVALARRRERGGVLYLPVDVPGISVPYLSLLDQTDAVYRTTAHHRPTPNGYSGYFPPSYFRMTELVRSLPGEPGLGYLRRIGVRFVVVRSLPPGSPWQPLRDPATAAPLRLLGTFDGELLYEVPDP